MTETNYTLAIVGLGPRGHFALESFVHELVDSCSDQDIAIVLFEESDQAGCGPVWDTSQSASNWSNINERILILPERQEIRLGTMVIGAFPDYHDWSNLRPAENVGSRPDFYPLRRTVGQYLSERFTSLLAPILQAGVATLISERVDDLSVCDHGILVTTSSGRSYNADQALLTVGHQPTHHDSQIKEWDAATRHSSALQLFAQPYPVEQIVNRVRDLDKVEMAVRGYGLATIDIARATAEALGTFEVQDDLTRAQSYKLLREVTLDIVPFSLDGLPMGPKPLTAGLDKQFRPSQDTLDGLGRHLGDPEHQAEAQDETFLLDAIVPIIATTYRALAQKRESAPSDPNDLMRLIVDWIKDPTYEHDCILSTQNGPVELLAELVAMATGDVQVSLDYCIGQVWRHCHKTIYSALSHSKLSDEVLARIIHLDESLKRYSFGPPVESLQQLIALHRSGVLNLDYVKDPDITVTETGCVLSNGSKQIKATIMIDAVLDPPKIKDVDSPLIKRLLSEGILMAVHDDLGVATSRDGFIKSDAENGMPVAVLGRLAKGTVIGVDSIIECFGRRVRAWAASAVMRVPSG